MSNEKKLLIEYSPLVYDKSQLNEDIKKNDGKFIVKNVLLQKANHINENKRRYSRPVLEKAIAEYVEKYVKPGKAVAELDHPQDRAELCLANVSHIIRDVAWDGDNVLGSIEILNTPSGNILKELILAGVNVGVSSRALGSVNEADGQDYMDVANDLSLITFDAVATPSVSMSSFLTESTKLNINKYSNVNRIISDIISEF